MGNNAGRLRKCCSTSTTHVHFERRSCCVCLPQLLFLPRLSPLLIDPSPIGPYLLLAIRSTTHVLSTTNLLTFILGCTACAMAFSKPPPDSIACMLVVTLDMSSLKQHFFPGFLTAHAASRQSGHKEETRSAHTIWLCRRMSWCMYPAVRWQLQPLFF